MEIGSLLSNYFSVSLYLVLLLLGVLVLRKKTRSNNLNLPPSPPKLPVIGNIHQLGQNLHRSLTALSDKYGPLMFLHLGPTPILIVSSPEILREIVESHDVVFSSRLQTTATDILFYGNKNLIFAPYGEFSRQVKKVCVIQLLSHKRVQSSQPVRDEEAQAMVSWIVGHHRNGNSSVDLTEALTRASNAVTSRCILGPSYNEEDGSVDRLGELSKDMSMLLFTFSIGDFIPWLRWVDSLTGFVRRLRANFRAFDEFNDRVVEEHEAAKRSLDCHAPNVEDFVDVLLRLQRDKGLGLLELTKDQIKAILLDMLAAGTETTTVTLEWLMAELLRKPQTMKKAQAEVRRVVGTKSKIEADDINHMNYLKCVVKETIRLHPPSPLFAPRETTTKVQIAGFDIPAKTRVVVNAWAIQRHPSYWANPEEFSPERFENGAVGVGYEYIPFGFGRRKCPGTVFGTANLEYLAANLLQWFDWESPDNLDMMEMCGIIVHKKVPLRAVARPYFL